MNAKKRKYFYDHKTETNINFISIDELKAKHPDGVYRIVGEVFIKEKNNGKTGTFTKKLLEKDLTLEVSPIGTYKENRYKTIGYVKCENEEYIAVKKKKNFLILIFLILLMLLMLGVGLLNINNKKADIDPNAGDYSSALKRPENIGDSQILVPGYGVFTIKKGSDVIDTAFFNPEGNPCFFKFTLIEESTNEILYESKLVPPGQGITPIKINKAFEEVGTYGAILKIQSFDFEDTDIEYNGSAIDVKLNVVE